MQHRLEENEGLGEQVAEEMVVGQSDALKVSCGVDLLQQLRELRLQNIHLQTKGKSRSGWQPHCKEQALASFPHLQVVLQVVNQEGHVVA